MALKHGSKTITVLKHGSTTITIGYHGDTQVFTSGSQPSWHTTWTGSYEVDYSTGSTSISGAVNSSATQIDVYYTIYTYNFETGESSYYDSGNNSSSCSASGYSYGDMYVYWSKSGSNLSISTDGYEGLEGIYYAEITRVDSYYA